MNVERLQSFQPISFDVLQSSALYSKTVTQAINGDLAILPLFDCEKTLFERVQQEAVRVVEEHEGQLMNADHATVKYVTRKDPDWVAKPDTLGQYSLYNSQNDYAFAEDDHHWTSKKRFFNTGLKAIPEFYKKYFGDSELQNCRLNVIKHEGGLGLHREKIIGIPHREEHFKFRFHLPLIVNPDVEFMMDNLKYKLLEGKVYFFNQGCMHGVRNGGAKTRIHLIFDCYLNAHIVEMLERANLGV